MTGPAEGNCTYERIGIAIGQLVDKKQAAYGNAFGSSGPAMRLLFPHGIPPARYDDALLLVRIWDKMKRVATDNDPDGESPYRDIAGYGILGAALKEGAIDGLA